MSQLLEELRTALSDRYSVESEAGRGGMATVFVAEDLKHGRRVAIKVLSPELSYSIDGDRFKREIQIAARLSHPHIVPIFDSGEANGLLYYTMPFIAGESLRKRLERQSQLPIEDAIAITCEVADALAYAHAMGVVHRDIKPENILLHGGHAVVADFGIARVLEESGAAEKLTQTGVSIGTIMYMSPEQFGGVGVDGRSDMYSLACVLYEMLVGQVPFTGPNAMAIMARHTMEHVPSVRVVRSSVPEDLENVLMKALEKTPADRFVNVAQFKEALLGGAGTASYRRSAYATPRVTTSGPVTPARNRRALIYSGAAIALLLVGGSFAALYRLNRPSVVSTAAGDAAMRRIAVLYLEDQSKDSTFRHVADGLTESLIAQLGQVQGLSVISPAGVAPFRNPAIPDDSVARALDVGLLVRGSVEPQGNSLKVSVRLVDGQSGTDFKRESFRVPAGSFLQARDSLARSVAEILRQRLGEEVRLRELRRGTQNADAWALVQRAENDRKQALRFASSSAPDSAMHRLAEADSLAVRAAALDAKWSEPLVTRGRISYQQSRLTKDPKQVATFLDSGLSHAQSALALDPRDPLALELRGTVRFSRVLSGFVPDNAERERVITQARTDLTDAVTIAPSQASAWYILSVLEYQGKQNRLASHTDAVKAYEKDAYLSAAPTILWQLYATSYDLQDFPDASKWCTEGHRRFPANPLFVRCRLYLAISKAVSPDPDSAWALEKQLVERTPKQDVDYERRRAQILVAIVLARAKLADSAHHVLAASRTEIDADPRGDLIALEALAYTTFGEHEQAITLLGRYMEKHPEHRAGFATNNSWWWQDLEADPRFKTLVATAR